MNAPVQGSLGKIAGEAAALEAVPAKGASAPASACSIPRRSCSSECVLSFAQRRLWFLDQVEPEKLAYTFSHAARLSGALDEAVLERCFHEIVRRHETLRTTFHSVAGEPIQRVSPEVPRALALRDLSRLPVREREAELERLLETERKRPFVLCRDLLLRGWLVRLAENEHVLLVTMHHIAADSSSLTLLLRELETLYKAFLAGQPSPLPELPIQYADFSLCGQQRNEAANEEDRIYWKRRLRDVPGILALPTDFPRPPASRFVGTGQALTIDREVTQALRELSRQQETTLFITLLAAFQTLLFRYSGQTDLVVGCSFSSRHHPQLDPLIGFFGNELPLRSDLSGNPTFRALLGKVHEATLVDLEHQDLPFEMLVEHVRPERTPAAFRSPLVQVLFDLDKAAHALQLPGISAQPIALSPAGAKYDLSLLMTEQADGLSGWLEYNTDLFVPVTISRLVDSFQALLRGIVANPDRPLADLPLLTPSQQQQVLVEWNKTAVSYPPDLCLHQLFEAQVERTPEAVAVVCGEEQLTYRDLNARANQLARRLRDLGVGPDVLVGLCAERSVALVVGLLGVLKAGGAYVPLDAEYPAERLAFMLQDAQAPVLLIQSHLATTLPPVSRHVVLLAEAVGDLPDSACPPSGVTPDHLAYVLYTSGSTGTPKGVMISHRAIVNHMLWMADTFPLGADDAVLQKTPLSFDASVWEFYAPLMAGVRLVMAPPGAHRDPAALVQVIQEHNVTILQLVPTLLRYLNEEPGLERCTSLRRVFCGGEALPVELVRRLSARLRVEVHNLYGPTEVTIDATSYHCRLTDPGQTAPIGRPIANTQMYVLDERRRPLPAGVPGELYIGGAGVARGYLNRPELTAERFIPNPFVADSQARLYKTGDLVRWLWNGNLEFLGRLDHQVKLRGFRIELGEIEMVLEQHAAVKQAVAIVHRGEDGAEQLIAYIATGAAAPSADELREHLRSRLPEYMVPAVFICLDELPKTPNGKVDRRSLPAPPSARSEPDKADSGELTPTEQTLVQIWSSVLGLKHVGVHDNFFELGGHSLLAVRVFAQIEKAFGRRLPLTTLLSGGTIKELAKQVQKEGEYRTEVIPIQPKGSKPPVFFLPSLVGEAMYSKAVAKHLAPDQPVYGIQIQCGDGTIKPLDTMEAIAARCVADISGVQPEGPYCLVGYSFAGTLAYEVAQQLAASGQQVKHLAIIDMPAPEVGGARPGKRSLLQTAGGFLRNLPFWVIEDIVKPGPRHLFAIMRRKIRAVLTGRVTMIASFSAAVSEQMELENIFDIGDASGSYRDLMEANLRASQGYKPKVYPGRVTLLRARVRPLFEREGRDLGWAKLAGAGVEIRNVPGNHDTILREPLVRHLAEQLDSMLNSA